MKIEEQDNTSIVVLLQNNDIVVVNAVGGIAVSQDGKNLQLKNAVDKLSAVFRDGEWRGAIAAGMLKKLLIGM